MIPSKSQIFVGGGDFEEVGNQFLAHFKEFGNITPESRILDVGCGIGRMAVPLTKFLNAKGSYHGFDIVPEGIDWCKKKISADYPNFHFQLVDIFNKDYNPKGKFMASEYKFPYENDYFDFISLTSVFTHMLPADIENYLNEIYRVLKKGKGICLITYFLLNDESKKLMELNKSVLDFKYNFENYRTTNKKIPEAVIAFEEDYIVKLYSRIGFRLIEPIHYGSFCGRNNYLSYQDIIIASK